jgi:molecular chaperone GrpE
MLHASLVHGGSLNRTQEYLEGWQRSRAELDNVRKRITAEYEQQRLRLRAEVSHHLLEIADNFRAVTQHIPEKLQEDTWAQGVLHVARQFERVLNDVGLTVIDAQGQMFDPTLHEALAKIKKEGALSGEVVEVLQAGYKMGTVTVRPAKVKIAE